IAGKCRGVTGVGVYDRPHIRPGAIDVPVEAPFARRPLLSSPRSIEMHQGNNVGRQFLIRDACGTDEKRRVVLAHARIAGRAMGQPLRRQSLAAGDQGGAELRVGHSAASRLSSGNRRANSSRRAAQTPRSVMRPVTYRAGVTSKAILRAELLSGTR